MMIMENILKLKDFLRTNWLLPQFIYFHIYCLTSLCFDSVTQMQNYSNNVTHFSFYLTDCQLFHIIKIVSVRKVKQNKQVMFMESLPRGKLSYILEKYYNSGCHGFYFLTITMGRRYPFLFSQIYFTQNIIKDE